MGEKHVVAAAGRTGSRGGSVELPAFSERNECEHLTMVTCVRCGRTYAQRVAEANAAAVARPVPAEREGPPRATPADDIAVGDVLCLNDWRLHVVRVEHDLATAVLTAELGFLLHFTRNDVVDVVKPTLAA